MQNKLGLLDKTQRKLARTQQQLQLCQAQLAKAEHAREAEQAVLKATEQKLKECEGLDQWCSSRLEAARVRRGSRIGD